MRNTVISALSLVAGMACASAAETSAPVAVHCGTIIDPAAVPQTTTHKTLIIESGRISRVIDGVAEVPSARNIDLRTAFCLPGLIDSHTHLMFESQGTADLTNFITRTAADQALVATRYARATVLAGFTTVRDVGSIDMIDVSLKHAIERGDIVGPRMFVAATHLSILGGHGDETNGLREDFVGIPDATKGVVTGPESAVHATRMAIKRGADVIKIMVSGGVLSLGDSASLPQFSFEEIRAIVNEARDHGLKVAAHAHGDIAARRAVEAGVASIEHGTFLGEQTYRLMKKKHVYVVPTLIAGAHVLEQAKDPSFFPSEVLKKAQLIAPQLSAALHRAYKAGVPIAFGTDAGVFPHGQNAKEFQYMVEAGMPPMQALEAATRNAADLIGKPDELGSLRPGYFADIVAVAANPLEDIRVLQSVSFVMKAGVVLKINGSAVLP